jgi:catechol 2,3-dioxygenase-like lactoylglutathione lyase family enzyme
MKLGKMMIFVSDLAEAKRFYCEVLGFPLKFESADRLEFLHEGCDFVAFKCEKNVEIEDYSNVAQTVFVFEVEAIVPKMSELESKGVRFLHAKPAENDFSRYAAFCDPFGNIHEIFERKNQ